MKKTKLIPLILLIVALLLPSSQSLGEVTVVNDRENGVWEYTDEDVSIHITRKYSEKPKLTWFETDIVASPQCPLTTMLAINRSTGKVTTSGKTLDNPLNIAKEYNALVAFNDDFFGYRLYKDKTPGIVVRDGKIWGNKTFKAGNHGWPCLDVLALFPDGSMETYPSNAYTAEEYIDMGVQSTFAFGPILVHDGKLDPRVEPDASFYTDSKAPRQAIGYISPFHYVVITAKGRSRDSDGATEKWLAQRFMELNCEEAFNFDGGGTTTLIFMGEIISRDAKTATKYEEIRKVSSLLGIVK